MYNMPDFKPGDKVIVKTNRYQSIHPTENRKLQPGDVVEVYQLRGDSQFTIKIPWNDSYQILHITDVDLFERAPRDTCICDTKALMWHGCKCGFLRK
jgi:hypothetical protein